MTATTERIQKRVDWFLHTFSGRNAQKEGDVPGLMARWLFRIGLIWACILLPMTVLSSAITVAALVDAVVSKGIIKSTDHGWAIAPLLVSGYAVWIGWGWRSRKVRSLAPSVFFWTLSAAFNLIIPILAWRNDHVIWVMFMPNVLWPILSSAASLVALFLEFRLPRHEENP